MRQKNTKQMLDYWMQLFWDAGNTRPDEEGFQDRTVGKLNWPERSDIQPSSCRPLLGNMFILEREEAQVNYRLAGTTLCSMYGRELKRETFAEAFMGADRRSAESWVNRLGREEYLVLICSIAETERGERINLETLLMPLNHHGERGNRILGITTANEQPYWLGVRPFIVQTIKSIRVLRPWETAKTPFDVPFAPHSFTDSQTVSTLKNYRRPLEAPGIFDALGDIAETEPNDKSVRRQVAHLTIIDGGLS